MDAAGLAAIITASSTLILGVLAWISGLRKDRRLEAAQANAERKASEPATPADMVLAGFRSLVADLQEDKAASAAERAEMILRHQAEVDKITAECDGLRRRLARYEGLEDRP